MDKLKHILKGFDPISLKEMDSVKLMDRTDTKYVFTFDQLPLFLEQLKNDYKILDVNGNRISRYESLYFDTKNFDLYFCHHRGKPNRFKIRFRKYVESELNFFEVKFKNNKGRTIKDRVRETQIDGTIKENAEQLLTHKTPLKTDNLEAKLWVNYSRITLVNKKSPERVTIDIDLTFKNEEQNKTIHNLVIAEVKQDKAIVSAFIKVMKKHHIREGSISKYCFGVISLFNKIKHNNFKPNLILIKKILYGTTART
ncbi:MAG: polyphosphate polymerase domain-containing protein [Bacteroidetes bacterium]|nr:polyphosphate polymerase domain-containing protein [Bacteroidota bacterium]